MTLEIIVKNSSSASMGSEYKWTEMSVNTDLSFVYCIGEIATHDVWLAVLKGRKKKWSTEREKGIIEG